MAKLVYTYKGAQQEFVFDPERTEFTVGRNPRCDIRVNNPSISRKHAELRFDPATDTFEVFDLNSSNGSFVNGERIRNQVLRHGDEILFGEFKFFFVDEPVRSSTASFVPGSHDELGSDDDTGAPEAVSEEESSPAITTPPPDEDENPHAADDGDMRLSLELARKERDRFQEQVRNLVQEVNALKEELENAADSDEVQRLRSMLEVAQSERDELREDMQQVIAERDESREAARALREQIEAGKSELEKLRDENREMTENVEQLVADRDDAFERLEHLRKSRGDEAQALDQAREQNQLLEQELERARAEIDEAGAQAGDVESQRVAELESANRKMREAFDDLSSELRELVRVNEELRAEVRRLNFGLDDEVDQQFESLGLGGSRSAEPTSEQ